MVWRDLLQQKDEVLTSPWVGGRSLRSRGRTWTIRGKLPKEHGWHEFSLDGRKARWAGEAPETPSEALQDSVMGYLVGDRLVPDGVRVEAKPDKLVQSSERVHLIELGLDRFVRVSAGRPCEDGPLIYKGQEFPLGPEDEVLQAFLDAKKNTKHIAGVAPALDVAFRFETWRRVEAERNRREERELLARLVQIDRLGRAQAVHERECAPVETGQFRSVDLDDRVVDPQGKARREQVLDGVHIGALETDGRAPARGVDVIGVRGDPRLVRQIGANEDDAVVRGSG